MNEKLIKKYYGEKFKKKETRLKSYDFLENFLSKNFDNYLKNRNTEEITNRYLLKLNKLSKAEVAFLLLHSGYIPDYYEHDSSEETLHTKLTETLIFHWAKLVGFNKSILPTQKSSYEDITISDGKNIIVCDAKSFRLGRSQQAPNVKDTIKLADYEKWLVKHKEKGIGGLITFPSLHDWKKGGDVYQYVSDPQKKVMLLFYEHISFFLILNYEVKNLVDLINDYSKLFNKKSNDKTIYWKQIIENLFKDNLSNFKNFNELAKLINQENAIYKRELIKKNLENAKNEIKSLFNKYKLIDNLIDDVTNTDSDTSDKLFNNVKIIKHCKTTIDRITKFRII
jgi:hypothetical protein